VAGLYSSTFSRSALRSSMPRTWDDTVLLLRHEELLRRLGPPDDDASAKDWQSWMHRTWWGALELRLEFSSCCQPSTRPTAGYVIAHLKGKYRPIDHWQLADSGYAAKMSESTPPNKQMQRTRHGQNGASPLICVFYGRVTGGSSPEWPLA